MTKRILALALINVLLGPIAVIAQEAKPQQLQEKALSKYEQFMSRKDALIVSKKYQIGKLEANGMGVWVLEAWELGRSEKIYAAFLYNKTVDFDQLQEMLEALDRMTEAIRGEFDKIEATSMSLSTKSGLGISYYIYDMGSGPKRHLYLLIKDALVYQGPSIEPLTTFRELISQARHKLVSLGAK